MNLLVAYATTDGMTARIAEAIAAAAREAGARATVVDAATAPDDLDLSPFDGCLVGASLHAQGYQRAARRFVRRHLNALNGKPSAFFSVCLAVASKNPEERVAARTLAKAFPAKLGWTPASVEVVAGALAFSRYGFLRRAAMKRIARKEMGDVDTTRDTVFTDWSAVRQIARGFVARVAAREAGAATAATAP